MGDTDEESNDNQDAKEPLVKTKKPTKSTPRKRPKSSTRQLSKDEEDKLLSRLHELADDSGGLKSEWSILTLVMIMREDQPPLVQSHLLDIISHSSSMLQEKMLEANMFMGILHHWLEKNMKTTETKDVLLKILNVFEKLPMSKEDIREIRIKVRKLSTSFKDQEVKAEALKLYDIWEKKRKGSAELSSGERSRKQAKHLRLNQGPMRKIGKAFVAQSSEPKKPKLNRHRSGPLSSSEIIKKRGLREMNASIKMMNESYKSKSQSSMSGGTINEESRNQSGSSLLDRVPSDAVEAVKRYRHQKEMEKFLKTAPSHLVHSMDLAPDQSMFYTHQRSLYHELKAKQVMPEAGPEVEKMDSKTEWKEPCLVRTPTEDLIRAPFSSSEKEVEEERQKAVPKTNSIEIFSSLQETKAVSISDQMINRLPFFAEDETKNEEQLKILRSAGVRNPAHFKSTEYYPVSSSPTTQDDVGDSLVASGPLGDEVKTTSQSSHDPANVDSTVKQEHPRNDRFVLKDY